MSRTPDAEPWQRARRVLAVRLENLCNVLMTTPALAAMRQCLPAAELTLLTSPAGAALAPFVDEIDQVLSFDAPRLWQAQVDCPGSGAAEQQLAGMLREQRFDAAVIFTACTQSALPAARSCRSAGIPLRLAHGRQNPDGLLSHWLRESDEPRTGMRHEVQRQLALVGTIGCTTDDDRLRMHIALPQRRHAQLLLCEAGVPRARPYFIVHPGADAGPEGYPAARFGSAADAIAARCGYLPIFTGDASDQPLIDEARRCMSQPSVTLVGRVGVPELAALIADARLLLSNNTAPAHVAAAVGTPVTVLGALTPHQHTPWSVATCVLGHNVEPDEVVRAAASLLRTRPEASVIRTGARQPMFETQGSTA